MSVDIKILESGYLVPDQLDKSPPKFLRYWYIKNPSYQEGHDPKHVFEHSEYYYPDTGYEAMVDQLPDLEKQMNQLYFQDRGCLGISSSYGDSDKDTINDIFDRVSEDLKPFTKLPFEFVKTKARFCSDYAMGVMGNDQGLSYNTGHFKHIHNIFDYGREYSHTISAVIPVAIREDVKEKVHFQWSDKMLDPMKSYNSDYVKFFTDQNQSIEAAYGPVYELRFPEKHEILLFEFNSSNWVHWVENFSKNIFLLSLFEDCFLNDN